MWQAYMEKNGPLSPMRKYDRPAALVARTLNRVHGGDAEMIDYMPFPKEEEKFATIDDIMAIARGQKIGK